MAPHRNASSPDRERCHALTPAHVGLAVCKRRRQTNRACLHRNSGVVGVVRISKHVQKLRHRGDSTPTTPLRLRCGVGGHNNISNDTLQKRVDQQRHMFCNMTPSTPDEVGELTHCQKYQQTLDNLSTARCLRSRPKLRRQENAAKHRSPRRHCGVVANRAESATAFRPIKNRSAGTRVREHPVLGKQCLMAKPDDHLMITQ